MRKILPLLLLCFTAAAYAQTTAPNIRPIKADEYQKAKTFVIKDLDNDTYAKFDNAYILDRYEMRKPYYITGDDGLKKRIDLYKLISKDSMQELGTVVYYTNEKGKVYVSVLPNFMADGKVWNSYFEDIHAIDKEEKNYVLKLSYILSKEYSFQVYKGIRQGKDLKEESGTYGNDICFPGDDEVAMADGSKKMLRNIQAGDKVITVDPATHQPHTVEVKKLVSHEARNYAITQLLVMYAKEQSLPNGTTVRLHSKLLQATPNHPMLTSGGQKKMGAIVAGDEVLCMDEATHTYQGYTVMQVTEKAGGVQQVYNMEVNAGTTFIMNGVMVMQK